MYRRTIFFMSDCTDAIFFLASGMTLCICESCSSEKKAVICRQCSRSKRARAIKSLRRTQSELHSKQTLLISLMVECGSHDIPSTLPRACELTSRVNAVRVNVRLMTDRTMSWRKTLDRRRSDLETARYVIL